MQDLTSELRALQENSDCSCMALTKISMCPNGWTLHNDSCYFFYMFRQTWDDARTTCERFGGHLVAIETMEEDDFVKGFIDMSKAKSGLNMDKYTWLGATDHLSEGVWLWVTGEKVALQDWRGGHVEHADSNGQPGVEDCMDYSFGAWNDNSCAATLPCLCEKEAAFTSN
ncbi:C-type lectin domain family 10 member A-like [Mizuhopecten yessoensis]|uniref:C-type lectin domain family 10 member A n=1 Tax=Mizuhopecten yessoensis TaxID=6573 RepID=A0A210PSW9_MIZYE|nr:C-type lectin domain family 10 member A-like [Mizuhopecten yessoensis]OWF39554.1 C-type lectin domain family 10 member A [Mizuhopecten yessoensis]